MKIAFLFHTTLLKKGTRRYKGLKPANFNVRGLHAVFTSKVADINGLQIRTRYFSVKELPFRVEPSGFSFILIML